MWTGNPLIGAAAGAAGTTTLNAVTYLDMALRGRPSSDTPQLAVERLTDAAHTSVPGGASGTTTASAVPGRCWASTPVSPWAPSTGRRTDPADRVPDLVPHLAYGLVTTGAARAATR
ncbi:hypothetical protein [Streptomyces sp. ICBB 8177]|uniref:hypothetical protein n=1 Tax=Streptomyces sp. ICBB 8177 TaxID=563922 RepID=UPI000D68476D|nr:hypothetical protein [Streptomyces sp. ICBB 8177]PWI45743.1 hypothetical protein CK485_00775 [Streptomyces sp. ICBB 8177]